MTVATAPMIDLTHDAVRALSPAVIAEINRAGLRVMGYTTGTPDVQWTDPDWAEFTNVHVRLDQGYTWPPAPGSYHGLDVENLAVTVAEVPGAVHDRIQAKIEWTTVYASDGNLAAVTAALDAATAQYGHGWYYGHVDCILANWSLSLDAAIALIGTQVHGLTCRGVQWASPGTNASTVIPGTSLTLAQANADLSVVDASWRPSAAPPPPPPPPPPKQREYVVVDLTAGGTTFRAVSGMVLK